VSQRIVSLTYRLCAAAESVPRLPPSALRQLDAARSLADAALDEARAAVNGLRPPLLDDLGLGACLRGLAHELPPGVRADVDVVDQPELDEHIEVAIYRMAQELLQNVAKHAQAHLVRVRLDGDAEVCTFSVSDDGVGFAARALPPPSPTQAYGLASLRARAALMGARLEVRSMPGTGTTVQFSIRRDRPTRGSEAAVPPA
jgi:two-component system NarL family sensor kinase